MDRTQSPTELFECEVCGNAGLGRGEITCCDRPMQPADHRVASADGGATTPAADGEAAVPAPTLDELLRTVFDMSGAELDVCLCVMEGGEQTVKDLAARVDYDRSVVARHLNHLVALGVVEKRRRLLEGGGHAYVYAPREPKAVRRNLRRHFVRWVRDALDHVDDLRREKVEAIAESETDAGEPQWRVYLED